jgi:hypothetical protein
MVAGTGTGTGGLIDTMPDRLRMSVADCVKAYKDLPGQMIVPTQRTGHIAGKSADFLKAKGKFWWEPPQECMKQMLRAHNFPDQELVMDDGSDSPAVFACAVERINSDGVVIRSCKSKEFEDLYEVCEIWEAA